MGFNSWNGFGGPFSGGLFGMQLINLVLLALWIWIMVDCARRTFKNDLEKAFWIIVMLAAPGIGSIAYLVVVKYSNPDGVLDNIQAAWNKTVKPDKAPEPKPTEPTVPTPNTPGSVLSDKPDEPKM